MSSVTTYNDFRHRPFNIDQFHVMILKRLALNPRLIQKSPEIGMTRYQILSGFEDNRERMSQETILRKTEELENNGLIHIINIV